MPRKEKIGSPERRKKKIKEESKNKIKVDIAKWKRMKEKKVGELSR
jgi:hypothetical protein